MVAASMNNLMTEIQSENPQFNDIPISYGGSISIVRRIENNKRGVGAVLLSSEESFDILDKLGYLDNELSYTFASNSLVLIGKTNKKIKTTKDIESIKKKVVIADPKIAPAGVYSPLCNTFPNTRIQNKSIMLYFDLLLQVFYS